MAKLTATKSGTAAVFNSGTTNVVATFTSTDGTGVIQLADSGGNVEIGAVGNDFVVQPAGGVAQLTVGSSSSTFAGNVALTGSGAKIISAISSDNDSSLFLSGAGSGKDTHIVFGGDRNLYLSKSSSATAVSEGTPVLTLGSNSNATFAGDVSIPNGKFLKLVRNSGSLATEAIGITSGS